MEIVCLANKEATWAERFKFRSQSTQKERQKCGKEYSALIEGFIQHLRYAVTPKLTEGHEYELFLS
jgi:hypothetical protein